MSDSPVTYERNGDVAVLRLDDGKANAVSHRLIDDLTAALDEAEADARAVVLLGRPGRFSAGFDLSVMTEGPDAARGLVTAGAELLLRLYTSPLPTVVACTGHALAMGVLVVATGDSRIGAAGEFKIGLNEVAIGMALPIFAIELARDRLSKRAFTAATIQARIYDPQAAVDAGWLDRVVPADELEGAALDEAARLAELRGGAYRRTKELARQATVAHIRETLAADMAAVSGPAT
jgi:enoyl-CoA hydratase